jgi:hypothetical protein
MVPSQTMRSRRKYSTYIIMEADSGTCAVRVLHNLELAKRYTGSHHGHQYRYVTLDVWY